LQELLGNTGAALRNTLKHNIPGTENGWIHLEVSVCQSVQM
jgi:hypothetical protein